VTSTAAEHDGVVVVSGLPWLRVGRTLVRVIDSSVLPVAAEADVGAQGELLLREPTGRIVHVEVVDFEGRPLPFATVWPVSVNVPGPAGSPIETEVRIAQFDGDVELLRPTTEAQGRIDCVVPFGRTRYCAFLGAASANFESDGDAVRVVLTAPE
jgi:hypothetical protein